MTEKNDQYIKDYTEIGISELGKLSCLIHICQQRIPTALIIKLNNVIKSVEVSLWIHLYSVTIKDDFIPLKFETLKEVIDDFYSTCEDIRKSFEKEEKSK